MQIEGSVRANLLAAIASARRLRHRPVHQDTLRYWGELIEHARQDESEVSPECLRDLVAELEIQMAERKH